MTRTLQLLRFELGYSLRRLSTWVYFAVLAGMSFLMMNVFGGAFPNVTASFGGSDGNVLIDSPYILAQLTALFALFGTLVVAALAGHAGYRDFGEQMHSLVFTTTTTKLQYLISRFLGAVVISVLVLSGVGFGLWLGSLAPWVEADRFGAASLGGFLRPYLVLVLPNVLFAAALFFGMAVLSRQRLPHYLGGTALLLGYMVANVLAGDLDTKWIAALADPFGLNALGLHTEYWTTIEKNTRPIGLTGWLLVNRLLWSGIAFSLLAVAAWRMRFSYSLGSRRRQDHTADDAIELLPPSGATVEIPEARRSFGAAAAFAQLRTLTGRAFREVVMSPSFAAILLAGVLFLLLSAMQLETIFGTRTWPMAWKVIEVLGGSFTLFVLILLTLYSGELVWRERDLKLDQVVDATPTPSWIAFTSKLLALSAIVVLLLVVVTGSGMASQIFLGFFRLEPSLYAQKLFGMQLVSYLLLAVFSLAVHTLVNHKYTGHFLLVLFYLAIDLAPLLGIEHALWRYGSDLGQPYSDMNQHGWYLGPFFWLQLYWGGVALVLAVLSNLLWPRGVEGGFRKRLRGAQLRGRTAVIAASLVGLIVASGAGAFVYYNTNVLNDYQSSNEAEELQARYEREYRQYLDLPQPRITAVSLDVDLYPERGAVEIRGEYALANRTDQPISEVHLLLESTAEVDTLELTTASGPNAPATVESYDEELGYRVLRLAQPLLPDTTGRLRFELAYEKHGFAHSINNRVVENGTFVSSSALPSFGYDPRRELALDRERAKHGLEPKERMADLDDETAYGDNYISRDADWVDFEATVSTSPDQIALAPGYLQREWTENGRRTFHYAMDAPILNFVSFLSARYEVERDQWNEVAIEVYHHPGHDFNVGRMIEAVKKSLAYFSTEFSPYQHRQLRIVEFPRYASFAQSFPNTVPYSESIGFIARVKEDDIDYPFYVTAHEVAHQWWAHQLIGANVQGATVLSETLSQYSALMVMEREYGAHQVRRFLEYELDQYLTGRSGERKKEVPLLRVENQPYIHYRKGSLILYAIRDAIGEQAVNRALSNLLDEWAFRGPPYPTSRALLDALLEQTPDELQAWVRELFEHIVIYEIRAVEASAEALGNDRFRVTLAIEARKVHAGEQGEEIEARLDDLIDIGVFDTEGEPLYLEKHRIDDSTHEITVDVEGEPARAGIDPFHKLIDRLPDDNEVRVETAS